MAFLAPFGSGPLHLSVDTVSLRSAIRQLGDFEDIIDDRGLNMRLARIARNNVDKHFRDQKDSDGQPWPKSKGRYMSRTKTHALAGIRKTVTTFVDSTGFGVVANHPMAALHNSGAFLPPRSKRYAIPLVKEMVDKRPSALGGRGILRMFNGKGFIVERSTGRFLFMLQKQVTIPKREFMYIDRDGLFEFEQEILDTIRREFLDGSP